MSRWVAGTLLLLTLIGLAVGAPSYSITVDDGIDTPDKEVTLEGSTFTVRGIAEVESGETLTASVVVPAANDGYRVYIYGTVGGTREIIDSKYSDSGARVAFDTSGFDPGTYTLALHTAGDYQAVYPFIVTGATVEMAVPETATAGDTVTLDAALASVDSRMDIAGVEFVIYGNDVRKRTPGTATTSGYTARIETSDLPPGEYTVYAVVQNDSTTPMGDPEPIGLSTQQTLSIEAESSGPDGQQTTTTTTPTTPTTTNTTVEPTTTDTTTSPPTATTATTAPTTTASRTDTSTPPTTNTTTTTTADNVIAPNTPTTTATSAPGVSLGASTVAVLLAVFLRRLSR